MPRPSDDEIRDNWACPHCKVFQGQPCINTATGKPLRPDRGIHVKRRMRLCYAEFLEGIWEGPICAKLKDHGGQHATIDGRTRWDPGAGYTYQQLQDIINGY